MELPNISKIQIRKITKNVIDVENWEPKTSLGKKVLEGEITSLDELFAQPIRYREPEIILKLSPDFYYAILDRKITVRVTDSGRKNSYQIFVICGNLNGYVGMGIGKSVDKYTAINKAIRNSILNLNKVVRGCGSWQCGCGTQHSIPFKVFGKYSSAKIWLLPAPRGTGLVIGDKGKVVCALAGIKDIWSRSIGETRTTINYCGAIIDALKKTYYNKFSEEDLKKVGVL
jgi:small subunit ribosomal protein S5